MVVETRGGGKRKDNPTKEETRRVKFAKTTAVASDNIEKTTTENTRETSEDSREIMAEKTSENSREITAEKTNEDSREITAGTETSEVALETAPTTVNKCPAGPSPLAPLATQAIGTHSGDEENDDENEVSKEGNGGGEEKDDENESSEEGNGDEEGKDDENEGSEEERDDDNEGSEEENGEGEELANGDRATNENENPPESEVRNCHLGILGELGYNLDITCSKIGYNLGKNWI
ncbi:unnamed protein product [Eruca vesicaria subsp. sativa]|uniref:Uncharacterized protein n=1 Tax=Eruca vesicaria subsp. sativa TaxID=29727 RepID=A0ABC8KUQ9_ERUVS|nr:unnamed protein product [Eruca vesicaria subsp. sativa]